MSVRRTVFVSFLSYLAATSLSAQKTPDLAPYLMTNRAAEIALARTAAPTTVSADASVMVLTATGFVEAARGTNGFTCLVMRSFATTPGDAQFWNPRIRAPHCFNEPATRTVLPPTLAQINWALAGATAAEMKSRTAQAYAKKQFGAPATGAMAYMLSPKQYLSDDQPNHWMPHLMFYYDRALNAKTFGAGAMSAAVIDASGGDPQSPMQVIYVPTRIWSDGTPASHSPPAR